MAERLMRRKEIYEIKYPEATRSAIASNNMKSNGKFIKGTRIIRVPLKSFVEDTAFQIGKSKITIKNYVQIATNISEDIRTLIKRTPLEEKLTDLLRLSRIKEEARQRELVEKIINGEATTIAGVIRKEKQTGGITLPDLNKPTVPTSLFKRLYKNFIDLEIKLSKLELENKTLKEQTT